MARFKKLELEMDVAFDPKASRLKLDGATVVMHCHHYATLYTQLAMDCGMIDAKKILAEVTEDNAYNSLKTYFVQHGLTAVVDRISIAEQHFAALGWGKMKVAAAGSDSGEVHLERSHVDEGWVKKFGKADKPVNYIAAGYIAGMFSAVFDTPRRTWRVTETASMAMGEPLARFNAVTC